MAGDWMPVRLDLPDDPAIISMAGQLELEEDAVLGKVIRFWIWVNQQLEKCHAPGVTKSWLDRYVRCDGFAESMVKVGWLELSDDGLTIPHFDRWHSKSAKKRLKDAERQRRSRSEKCHDANVTPSSLLSSSLSSCKKKRNAFAPPTVDEVRAYADEIGSTSEAENFVDYFQSNGWKVGRTAMKDWQAAFRRWSREDRTRNGQQEIKF